MTNIDERKRMAKEWRTTGEAELLGLIEGMTIDARWRLVERAKILTEQFPARPCPVVPFPTAKR